MPRPVKNSAKAEPRRSDHDVDVVVIGGGVNGTGVARDASMRGLRVALFERNDLAFGASGNNSGLIHGGPRYMLNDPNVTATSCRDSGYIQRIAPHMLHRVPFLMPVENKGRAKIMFALIDAFFEAYDRYQPLKHGKKHAMLTAEEMQRLEPGLRGNMVGGISFDEWGIDGARLCAANAVDASERGARIFVGCTVERIERREDTGEVVAVHYRDRRTGGTGSLRTGTVINATGAWAPITASLGRVAPTRARVRPGKGIHVVYDRRLLNYAVAAQTIDGRQIFVAPWQNMTIVGTTDDDFYGDLDEVRATSEEVRYLVQGVARVFPQIHTARAIGTYAGVRPTLYAYGPHEDRLSREHEIVDHAEHQAPGVYSMIGGKLASYRIFAEEMTDVLAARFDLGARCATHERPLPGGDAPVDAIELAARMEIDPVAARRLVFRHGSRSLRIAERVHERPREAAIVCACEPVIEAEVRHVVRTEWARSVSDVARRTRLGLGACGGMRCAARCGQIVAQELELPPREGLQQAARFLARQAQTRAVALGPEQAQQEALAIAAVRAELGVDARDLEEGEAA
ncbi:glycerol-3-phosphate dehydrogenase/oxidase [Polyangium spumosum]|uniref:Glycerol-3-phosphate dehydrogenase n=1 Tax=Polyangium spumosum TaxID=889282 RepID=A0A6N7PS99_9BACT|nr:glycerol-3-phosphate dehydrogenase/oxidase [Polyangium spumosum]MRG94809.1 FAD-dependent oxidoreductase [Polyangium spumosum]